MMTLSTWPRESLEFRVFPKCTEIHTKSLALCNIFDSKEKLRELNASFCILPCMNNCSMFLVHFNSYLFHRFASLFEYAIQSICIWIRPREHSLPLCLSLPLFKFWMRLFHWYSVYTCICSLKKPCAFGSFMQVAAVSRQCTIHNSHRGITKLEIHERKKRSFTRSEMKTRCTIRFTVCTLHSQCSGPCSQTIISWNSSWFFPQQHLVALLPVPPKRVTCAVYTVCTRRANTIYERITMSCRFWKNPFTIRFFLSPVAEHIQKMPSAWSQPTSNLFFIFPGTNRI